MRYTSFSKARIEDHLSKNLIPELCSDASLILSKIDTKPRENVTDCMEACMTFICSWYDRRWPTIRLSPEINSARASGIYDHSCFDRIAREGLPPLTRWIESCLVEFSKRMNTSWTCYGNKKFSPGYGEQATTFSILAETLEDAMDEIPDSEPNRESIEDQLVSAVEALTV